MTQATATGTAESIENFMTVTSDTYLAFGHGRRKCPGRWIYARLFKVLIA